MSYNYSNVEGASKNLICVYTESRLHAKNVIITFVALLAISTLIIGTLALLVNLNISTAGLAALSQIPLPASIGLIAIGVAGIIALIIQRCSQGALSKNNEFSSSKPVDFTLDTVTLPKEVIIVEETKPEVCIKNGLSLFISEYEVKPLSANLVAATLELLNELNIHDLTSHLKNLYGDSIPQLFLLPSLFDCGIIKEYLKLFLLTDEALLNLKISEINDFQYVHIPVYDSKISILHLRLNLIEKNKHTFTYLSNIDLLEMSKISLREFRSLDPNFIMRLYSKINLSNHILSLLCEHQFLKLCSPCNENKFTAEHICALFPITDFNHQRPNLYSQDYVRSRLQLLKVEFINKNLQSFNPRHLRLLSEQQLNSTQFPWHAVVKSYDICINLFSTTELDNGETKRILETLSLETLNRLNVHQRLSVIGVMNLLPESTQASLKQQCSIEDIPYKNSFKFFHEKANFSVINYPIPDIEKMPQPLRDLALEILKDYGIDDLAKHLTLIYKESIPSIELPNLSDLNSIDQDYLREISPPCFKLFIQSDTNILSLKIPEIVNEYFIYDDKHYFVVASILCYRLSMIAENVHEICEIDSSNENDLTIKQLRSLDYQKLSNFIPNDSFPTFFILSLCTKMQINNFVATQIKDENDFDKIFMRIPFIKKDKLIAQLVIRQFNLENLLTHFNKLSGAYLTLLSDAQLTYIPWHRLTQSREWYGIFGDTIEENKHRLQLLNSGDIRYLLIKDMLRGHQLACLSDNQYTDPDFPWEFIVNRSDLLKNFLINNSNPSEPKRILNLLKNSPASSFILTNVELSNILHEE